MTHKEWQRGTAWEEHHTSYSLKGVTQGTTREKQQHAKSNSARGTTTREE